MSKIPYRFIPIPQYFDECGLLDDPKTEKLIRFLFRRTRTEGHFVFIEGREIYLEPFEFIFGRDSVSLKVGITGKACWTRMEQLKESKLISTVDSKRNSKYTVYKWLTENFDEKRGQQKEQQKVQQGNSTRAEKGTARGTQCKNEDDSVKIVDLEVIMKHDHEALSRPPLSTNGTSSLSSEIEQNLALMQAILNDPRVQAFKVMDGSLIPQEVKERWVGKLLKDFFKFMEWYSWRVTKVKEENKKLIASGEQPRILGIKYLESGIQKAHWKQYEARGFAKEEDEKQAKRHARNE